MKSNVEKLSSIERKLTVEIPATNVQSSFDRIFEDIQKDVTIKGFRKGKAPLATIKSLYHGRVKQDVVQDLIQKHYAKALREHQLSPVSYPEFEFDDLQETQNFNFSAIFEIMPEIQLKKYENLTVEKEIFKINDDQVQKTLEEMRNSKVTFEKVTEIRPAQMGDISILDFEGFVDAKPLENGAGNDQRLELGKKQFIEGFEEGIVGMNVGDTKTLNLKFPTPYHAKDLEGKDVTFNVTLKGLEQKVLPELNDEFVKGSGTGVNTLDELKKIVREEIESSEKKRIEDAFKNRLIKILVKENPVEIPPSILRSQKDALIEDFKKRMSGQGMDEGSLKDYIQKWDKDFEKTASEMVQASFIIETLGEKYDLLCKKEDLDQKFSQYAAQTGIDEARIREFYEKEDTHSRLTYQITEEKVIQKILSTASIKEVTKDSLKEEEN